MLADAAYSNGFGFRQRLRGLGLEFFLQVTPQEHHAWTEEVPTVLNGKYRTVDEATAEAAADTAFQRLTGTGRPSCPVRRGPDAIQPSTWLRVHSPPASSSGRP